MNKDNRTRKIALTGLMAALVFAGSKLQIPLVAEARIHLGNVMCLLAGYILGPIYGGLAAGLGSAAFDLTDPRYVSSIGFTLVFKFMLSFVCGKISWYKGNNANNTKLNFFAGAMGILTYMCLYIPKDMLRDYYFRGVEMGTVWFNAYNKLIAASINGIIAVLVAVPLAKILKSALRRTS